MLTIGMSDARDDTHVPTAWTRLNATLTDGPVGRYFECRQRNTTFFQELRAGVVCFLTVCYIIPVNSGILSETGGSCDPAYECSPTSYAEVGENCKFTDTGYAKCVAEMKNDLIAATCIAAMLSTFLMSIIARMPLAVAPAMGVNAYFTYTVVGYYGTGRVSYKQALAAAFVEGWIFLFVSVTGIRGRLVELIPKSVMYGTAAGIGLFLSFVGFQQAEGIGLITYDPATLVTLGGCPKDQRMNSFTIHLDAFTYDNVCASELRPDGSRNWFGSQTMGAPSPNYKCAGGQMTSATTLLGVFTGVIMVILMMKDVKGSILIGILFCTFISWIPTHDATYFRDRSDKSGGEARYQFFLRGAKVPSVDKSGGHLDFSALNTSDVWIALITFLYLDFMDATSTMFAMARLLGDEVPGFLNSKGQWPRQLETMLCDGIAIVIGSVLGTSPLTVFAESAVGIREGGRTGITAFVVACGFGIAMFLAPIFASIPPWATGPAIILVGSLMMEQSAYVFWDDIRQAAPAFLTIILMPLTYSIAYGVIAGMVTSMCLWAVDALWEAGKVFIGAYKGEKTLYHVYLDSFSHFFVAFDKEYILLRDLPGYIPIADMFIRNHGTGELQDANKSVHASLAPTPSTP